MAKNKISEFDVNPDNNTDINSINIAEGCAPSGINNAIRQLMSDLKEFQTGGAGDPFNGAVNGTVGATTPASGSFTSLTDSGNLTFTGTGNRITGDFGNATVANRVMFQTSTANQQTSIGVIPNGTSTSANINLFGGTDPANASLAQLVMTGSEARLGSIITGTGTYLPLTMYTGGSERLRIDTSGNVGIGTSSPLALLQLNKASGAADVRLSVAGALYGTAYASASDFTINSVTAIPLVFGTNNTERMRIDSSGNVGIGTSSPSTYGKFVVNGSANADAAIFIGNSSLTGSAPTYKGTVRILDNPTSTTGHSGGLEFLTSTFGSGYGWKMASIDSSGVQLTFSTRQNSATWSEAMRIDSGGNVLIGTTSRIASTNAPLQAYANGGSTALFQQAATTADNLSIWNSSTTANNIFVGFYTEGTPTARGSIDYNRAAGQVRYNTTSDATLKNLIGDSDKQKSVEILGSTRIREYAWKDDSEQKPQIGVIAQELYETYKGAVVEGGDDSEGNYRPWGVDKTAFTFHLIAGWQEHQRIIQEQQAIITDLKARIETLESK